MTYDLYVDKPSNGDVFTQLRLLVTETGSVDASKKFVRVVHSRKQSDGNVSPSKYVRFIGKQRKLMQNIGLASPSPDLSILPSGSWFLQFTFTLAKPWISKDDDLFYVTESVNPVRKDKVFKVPMMSAAAWKGLLRWTLMHIRLAQKRDNLDPQQFATERFVQTLLFGDEQGEEPGQRKGFAKYVDELNPKARTKYERLLRGYFKVKPDEALPHHSGRLIFYPTFFDAIDVEVINPHSRETRAGTHPIYLECVPPDAKGTFTLLYVPFDLIGHSEEKIRQQAFADLQRVAEGLQAMFITYGFGAKTSSGFGLAADKLPETGNLCINYPSAQNPITEDFNSLSLLKRKADALKRLIEANSER